MRTRTERICEYCGNKYSRKEHYERHVRTHTRERPFQCIHCQSTFARRDTWRRHVRTNHAIANPSNPATPEADTITLGEGFAPVVPLGSSSQNVSEMNTASNELHSLSPLTPHYSTIDASRLDACDGVNDFSTAWQWDDSLDLDPSFSLESLGTYDLFDASPSLPWLPLKPFFESREESASHIALPKPIPQMSRHWFTHTRANSQAPPSPAQPTLTSHGEDFSRDVLASSLQQRVPDTSLPSNKFLSRCIHIFMTKLWHLCPIVHLPTFKPSRTNPLLLLSICSLGALADGSQDALYHGERLYKAINKAILVSSTPGKAVTSEHALAVLQAAAVGQTYSLLSGKATDLMTSQYYHGTLSLAVRALQNLIAANQSQHSLIGDDPERDWKQWIERQSIVRLLNSVSVHNGEISTILHKPASFRVNPLDMEIAAPDALFLAKTSEEWKTLNSQIQTRHAPSNFSICAKIECFISEMGHAKAFVFDNMSCPNIKAVLSAFQKWFSESIDILSTDSANKLATLLLCHSFFVNAFSNLNTLEKVCGRDGTPIAGEDVEVIRRWASTFDTKRCVVHAMLIITLLERFRVTDIPPIHASRAAFHAGLILAIYTLYAPTDDQDTLHDPIGLGPEFTTLWNSAIYTDSEWSNVRRGMAPEHCRTMAFGVTSVLRHLGPWPNAKSYANTLEQVLKLLESS